MGLGSRRRWALRALVALLVVLTVVGVAFGALLLLTPGAGDAPSRVASILRAHGQPSDAGVVPAKVAGALLAVEDSRYYHDPAIDPLGTLRGMWGFVTSNPNEGGATIEVQLAKLLYTPGRSDPAALLEQMAIAMKMDRDFSKNRILALYLDAAYFGDGAYGVTAASKHYFGVPAGSLSWGQAALLAGLVQLPSSYDPRYHLSAALARRAHVLARLVAVGRLTKTQAQQAAAGPLQPAFPFGG